MLMSFVTISIVAFVLIAPVLISLYLSSKQLYQWVAASMGLWAMFGQLVAVLYFWRQRSTFLVGGEAPFGADSSDGLMLSWAEWLYVMPGICAVALLIAALFISSYMKKLEKSRRPTIARRKADDEATSRHAHV
jgi:hypothetical protein